jgi:signal transduction histidine kinase
VYLLLAALAIFIADSWINTVLYEKLYETRVTRDHYVLAEGLGIAVEAAWRDYGIDYARGLVREANERESQMTIRWVRLDAPAGDPEAPQVPIASFSAGLDADGIAQLEHGEGEGHRFYTYSALSVAGGPPSALELSDSFANLENYMRLKRHRKIASGLAMSAIFGVLAWLAGIRLVGRPVHLLVEKARRIGAGDFAAPLVLRQRDELSELADEMNSMAERLDAATRRIATEAAARVSALEQLRHADRLTTVGELASGIAHELGTPLNVITGRARMIAAGETESAEQTSEFARIIIDQAGRMTSIVRQLLDFARARKPAKGCVDLCSLARQTATLLEPLAHRRGVSLRIGGACETLSTEVDGAQMQQVLTNLVVNAMQASPRDAEVAITVDRGLRAPPGSAGAPERPCALIGVRDRGPGIPEGQLQSIFDPFYTTKEVGEGTGLGLSVAYGIVVEHGGWIEVQSEIDRGSSFVVCLPLEAANEPAGPDRR